MAGGMVMEKGIIVFRSKYGAARKYARWLQEATGFSCVEVRDARPGDMAEYETIVFCGGIYASGIARLSFLKKNIDKWTDKKVAILCVGASPYDKGAFEEVRAHNLTGSLQGVPLFYGRGAFDESKMGLIDRTLCKMLRKSVAKKDPDAYEPWERAIMSSMGHGNDWTDKVYLRPLLDYIKA